MLAGLKSLADSLVESLTRPFTEHREAERRLCESERRFRLLVEGVKDYAIFMLSPEGNIASWNIGAERIKGYRTAEIIGKHFSIFYTEEAIRHQDPQKKLEIARTKGVYEEEGLRVRKDGSRFWANVVITALFDENGNLQGFAKVTRDITERKRIEAEREEVSRQLERKVKERTQELELSRRELLIQRDQLARSNADLQQFAYVASHDLQEPLRSVITCHQLIQQNYGESIPAELLDYMRIAIESSNRMKCLIEGLLEYGQVGHAAKIERAVDLNQLVRNVILTLTPKIEETKSEIKVDRLPIVMGDQNLLSQVIQNLIVNAIKYTEGQPAKIEISAEHREGFWEISVKDNGIGIEPNHFERIFVIFQRLHSDRKKFPGTGIGLAVCKRIIEGHGGKIWVTSTRGKGSTFTFTLPEISDYPG